MKIQLEQLALILLSSLCLLLFLSQYPIIISAVAVKCGTESECISSITPEPFNTLFGEIETEEELLKVSNRVNINAYYKYLGIFKKFYSDKNVIARQFEFFKKQIKHIVKSNIDYLLGRQPYKLGINKFSDRYLLTDQSRLEDAGDEDSVSGNVDGVSYDAPPLANGIDYRSKNCVTQVEDQGDCGSCYGFAALSVIETLICTNPKLNPLGKPPSELAVQEVLDCFVDALGARPGCKGGFTDEVLDYFITQDKAISKTCYEYKASKNQCLRDVIMENSNCIVQIRDEDSKLVRVDLYDSDDMIEHLDNYGTIAVIYYVSQDYISYSGGVLIEKDKAFRLNKTHATVIVGYGSDDGIEYWLVKNSKGPDWGLGGYFKVIRGVNAFEIEKHAVGLKYIPKQESLSLQNNGSYIEN